LEKHNNLLVYRISRPIMSEAADIAIVSFDKFIEGDDAEKRAVAKQLYEAFSTVGWVYLKDHGILQERVDEVFELVRRLVLFQSSKT
jgi:isopenicillin N synthase-like dioxygenase